MRSIVALALLGVVAACAHGDRESDRAAEAPKVVAAATYYDRNLDGVADLELHQPPHCDDCDWALVDIDFDGRYERRVIWSFGMIKEEVDKPVPKDVDLVLGFPSHRGWE